MSKQTTLLDPPLTNGQDAVRGNAMTTNLPSNPLALIQSAIDQKLDPDQLGKLMDLHERHERNRAAEDFCHAVTEFQRLCPPIHKSRNVNAGPLRYQYASFDDVMRIARPVLSQCGIALSFSTEANDRGIRVTCRIRVGIHTEDCTLDVPIPDMRVNDTQKYGAALSYAKRYALCAALNIVVTDEDNDAAGLGAVITQEQEATLQEWIAEKNVNAPRFLEWLGVKSLADVPAAKYQMAIDALKKK